MNGAQRDKVIFFPAKITNIGLIDNFPFVFSRASNKNVFFLVPLQSHFNQSGEVRVELLTNDLHNLSTTDLLFDEKKKKTSPVRPRPHVSR